MSLSDYELHILAELEEDLDHAARRRQSRRWGIALVVVVAVSVVAPVVATGVWIVVGFLLVTAGAVVVVSDGVRVAKELLHH